MRVTDKRESSTIKQAVLSALASEPMTSRRLAERTGYGPRHVAVAISRLRDERLVRQVGDEKNEHNYFNAVWGLANGHASCALVEAWPMPVAMPSGRESVTHRALG